MEQEQFMLMLYRKTKKLRHFFLFFLKKKKQTNKPNQTNRYDWHAGARGYNRQEQNQIFLHSVKEAEICPRPTAPGAGQGFN